MESKMSKIIIIDERNENKINFRLISEDLNDDNFISDYSFIDEISKKIDIIKSKSFLRSDKILVLKIIDRLLGSIIDNY
jgi:hypothetical protein